MPLGRGHLRASGKDSFSGCFFKPFFGVPPKGFRVQMALDTTGMWPRLPCLPSGSSSSAREGSAYGATDPSTERRGDGSGNRGSNVNVLAQHNRARPEEPGESTTGALFR